MIDVRCPACGTTATSGSRFCASCGASLSGDSPTVPGEEVTRLTDRPRPSPPVSTPSRLSSSSNGRFAAGYLLGDRYRIVRRLGRGGMGEVYLADDLRLAHPVALKFLPEAVERDPDRLAQLQSEVRLARQVSHPNVCRVYDLQEAEGVHFLAMEYVDGEDLASVQRRIGRLPEDRAVELARQIAAGVAAVHARGMLHRDLKPANVLIDGEGRVRLADFGLAATADGLRESDAGTPAYMAPEQLRGAAASDRSDIFALGLVLYELFTGRHAFTAKTIDELQAQHEERSFQQPSAIVPGLNPAINRVIVRCLEPHSADRPGSALSVAAALPGGDPLAAALAAGETPSPELVAASGGEAAALSPVASVVLLAATVALVIVTIIWSGRYALVSLVNMDLPMAALEDRARTFEASLGLGADAVDRVSGLSQSVAIVAWLRSRSDRAVAYTGARPPALLFWYRSSPRPLVPTDNSTSHPNHQNPPLTVSGMTLVTLDTKGRVVDFQHVPPQIESTAKAPAVPVDWTQFFKAAGLDPSRFALAAPDWTPRMYADARTAWLGTVVELPDVPLRVEAASHQGRPVSFQIIGPWVRPARIRATPVNPTAELVGFIAVGVVVPGVLLGAALLARRNLRRGRGDRRGAIRLAIAVFALELLRWVFAARHYPDVALEQARLGQALSGALFAAALGGLLYLAVEPQVRRHRPAMLVTWSRLISGRFRDPLFGRDLVIGAVVGLAMTVITYAQFVLPAPFAPDVFSPLGADLEIHRGAAAATGYVLQATIGAILIAFAGAAGSILLRLIVPNFAIAAVLATVFFSPLAASGQIQTERLWLDLLFGVALVVPVFAAMVRYGVVAGAAAFLVHFMTLLMPLTLDPSRLLFGWSVAVLALVFVMAIAGVVLARGREPLLGGLIADD